MSEKVELTRQEPKKLYSAYQKTEYSNSPESDSWSCFGGSGINFKLTDRLSVDGFFAGKTASKDKNGYQTDFTANYSWANVAGIDFASQSRLRYQNCGSENLQLRTIPAKLSFKNKNEFIPIDEVYSYPIYTTLVHDFNSNKDIARFGALAGLSKKLSDKISLNLEIQTDTDNEKFSGRSWCATLGFKYSFSGIFH